MVHFAFYRSNAVHDLGVGAGQEFFQVFQLLGVDLWFLLFAQVLRTAFERQARLAGLVLLQGVLAKVVEELDVQQHQNMTDLADPALGFVGRQETVLCGAGDLAVQGFKKEAHVLGLGFGLDRCRWIVDRDRFALAHQSFQFSNPCLEVGTGLFQVQQALADIQFQTRQQQLERRCHQLAGEGLGDLTATTQAIVEFNLGTGPFQLIVFHHMVDVANGDQ
ncbi:hypothetical protein D3C86_1437590 [compost metagenome]